MFRRSKSDASTPVDQPAVKPDGKGRPTPSRKEAEAAAKARAKVPRTRKELARAQREVKTESSQKDERFYMARDRGPVRRFVRDFVDSRFSFIELMIPLLILTMVLGYSGNSRLANIGNTILLGTILLVVLDMVMLRFRLRRELTRRFPDEDLKGTTYYALIRGLQMKFMRLPKSKVKIGQRLPEHYR